MEPRFLSGPLRRIHAEPIDRTPRKAVRYALKALERGRITFDDLIIFPFSRSELSLPSSCP